MAFLWKERRENRIPPWVRDFQQDDWITRAEFDQYHLHVIQMSQAQRELLNSRLDEISKKTNHHEDSQGVLQVCADSMGESVAVQSGVDPTAQAISEADPAMTPVISPAEGSDGSHSEPGEEILGADAPSRAISLFREGKTIDQIAQELRIGRQEAQLLIRMAQHRPSSLAGV